MSTNRINLKEKSVITKATTALLLILTLTLCIFATAAIQPAYAVDTAATYCFVAATPNPVGVNQWVQVSFWLANSPPTSTVNAGDRWQGLTLTITKPDGTTETKGPYNSDPIGGYSLSYLPTTIGTYKFQMHFPGQRITGMGGLFVPIPIDIQYKPCDSAVVSLTVQQTPAIGITPAQLPTSYWTRPINGQNDAWNVVSGNWLMTGWDWSRGSFDQGSCNAPYNYPPQSPHILWTKPMTFGGLLGAEYGSSSFYSGMSYEQFFKPPVIISGRLYYQTIGAEAPPSASAYGGIVAGYNSVTCVDMATGQTIMVIPNMTLAFGQIYDYVSPNQAGGYAYLWDTSTGVWKMYDAWTGQYMLSISGVPSGTTLLSNTDGSGPGDVMVYSLSAGKLTLWNSSLCFYNAMVKLGFMGNVWMWRPYFWAGQTLNGSMGIQWTKTLQDAPAGGSIFQIRPDNTVYVNNGTAEIAAFAFPSVSTWCGYSMTDGNKLWGPTTIDIRTKLPPNATGFAFSFEAPPIGAGGILPIFCRETLQSYAWNVKTGAFMWGPTTAYSNAWSMYNWELEYIVNGRYYNPGYDGKIHVFDANNGNELWTFYSGDAGTITPYGTWPFYNGLTMAGDTVIATTGDHGNGVSTLYQGEHIFVLDQVTGQQRWNASGWFEMPAIADGMMVSHNNYDNQIYCFGKGPSATTVAAPLAAVAQGNAVTITGSVTDQSVGAKGTPAISDDWQSAWMAYMYSQQPKPTNAKGVTVVLSTTDPNGNTYNIGNVTSDISGNFGMQWTPPVPGLYQVIATFTGSNSYYGSSATTYMTVEKAAPAASPAATATPPPTAAPTVAPTPIVTPTPSTPPTVAPTVAPTPAAPGFGATETYAIAAAVIVIIVVAIGAVALRRRK